MFEPSALLSVYLLTGVFACQKESSLQGTPVASSRAYPTDSAAVFTALHRHDPLLTEDEKTRAFVAWVDLNGDGRLEAIVHLLSIGACGSGGCTTFVLQWDDTGRSSILLDQPTTDPPLLVGEADDSGYRTIHWMERGRTGWYFTSASFTHGAYAVSDVVSPRLPVGEVVIQEYTDWTEAPYLTLVGTPDNRTSNHK